MSILWGNDFYGYSSSFASWFAVKAFLLVVADVQERLEIHDVSWKTDSCLAHTDVYTYDIHHSKL